MQMAMLHDVAKLGRNVCFVVPIRILTDYFKKRVEISKQQHKFLPIFCNLFQLLQIFFQLFLIAVLQLR